MVIQYPEDFNKAFFKKTFSRKQLSNLVAAMSVPNITQALFLLDRPMTIKRIRQVCAGVGAQVRIGNYSTGMTIYWNDFKATLEENKIVHSDIARAIKMSRAQFCVMVSDTKNHNTNVRKIMAIADAMRVNIIISEAEGADT